MTQAKWKKLLKTLPIKTNMGIISPVEQATLDAFENASGVRLPSSYRSFCSVFGAGDIGGIFKISVPGYQGETFLYSLEKLSKFSHDEKEYVEYSPDPDPAQHARSIFFAMDIFYKSKYFFDPDEITDTRRHEYGIYILYRDWKVKRVADNFGEFITELCLGDRYRELIGDDEPPEQLFQPVN